MKLTFLVPPVLDHNKPAERTAGCTRIVYAAPNIYELTVVAVLEQEGYTPIYRDFVYYKTSRKKFEKFLKEDDSDIYYIWTVNLSIENDLIALSLIRKYRPNAFVVFMGPGPTYFTDRFFTDEKVVIVRGEPEVIVKEWTNALRDGTDWKLTEGISYLKNGKIIHNKFHLLLKDLDSLPFPARHHIADRDYHNPKLKISPYTTAITSRNCPYQCIYCVPSSLTFAREIENRREFKKKPFISFRSIESIEKDAVFHAFEIVFSIICFQSVLVIEFIGSHEGLELEVLIFNKLIKFFQKFRTVLLNEGCFDIVVFNKVVDFIRY